MRARSIALSCALLLSGTAAASSQAADTLSFSRIEIAAGVSGWVAPGALADRWRLGPGVFLSLVSPYGPGVLRLSVEAARSHALEASLPHYTTLFPSLQWGPTWTLPGGVRAVIGGGTGALWMDFNEPRNPTEIEVALVGSLQLRKELPGGWGLGGTLNGRRILLSRPTNQLSVSIEVGRSVSVHPVLKHAVAGGGSPRVTDSAPTDATVTTGPTSAEGRTGVRRADEQALRDHGVIRLAEIFRGFAAWDVSSVDQRAVWAAPDGLHPFSASAPSVLVDGIPVPLEVLGATALDRLPITLEGLEEVEATSTPALLGGRFRESGGLSFRTALPASNRIEVFASAQAENPTGDPGPFHYTDSSAGNVDKLGTAKSAGLLWRRGPFAGSAGVRSGNDVVTDVRLGGRTLSLRDPMTAYPVIRTRVEWVSLRWVGEWGRHDLRAGRSVRADYFFLPALGVEVPARSSLEHAGVAGRIGRSLGLAWEYQAHASWDDLSWSTNHLMLDFDLDSSRRGAQTGLTFVASRARVSLGLGMDEEIFESGLLPAPVESRTPRAYLSSQASLRGSEVGAEVELRRNSGDVGGSLAGWGRVPVGAGAQLGWTMWHSRRGPGEATDFWALHERGYAFLDRAGVDVESTSPATWTRDSGGQLEVTRRAPASLELGASLRLSRTEGMRVAQLTMIQDGVRPAHARPIVLSSAGGGTVAVAAAEARWTPAESFQVELRYRRLSFLSGDPLLRSAWGAFPTHRFSPRLAWSARGDLRIAAGLEASSATTWAGFERMGKSELPGRVMADLSLEKTFWEERVHMHGRVMNLLDQTRPSHPLGSAPGLAFAVGATARLGR